MPLKKIILYFIFTYSVFCFIALNRHANAKPQTYHCEIWADKAGYNVYLPCLFIYHFDANRFPEKTEAHVGYGFTLDSSSQHIITKYPYGVSLMQSPFWLIAHALAPQKDGFSTYYQKAIDFAGSFYLTLGLFFLFFTARRYHSISISASVSLLIALSTGIFYYGIYETGMSHIYSFCCIAIILFLALLKEKTRHHLLWLVAISSLYVIIRPLNSLFLLPILLSILLIENETFRKQFLKLFNLKISILSVLIVLVFILPQLVYYHYAYGSFIADSYQNEPFYFPSFNRIIELLFSPDNGLFIYYPVLVIIILYSFIKKYTFSKLSLFLLISYIIIYASWWSLSLGCGFGHRAINDLVIVFFIPILISEKKIPTWLISIFIICALINIKFMFSYDTCLYTSTNWDFTEYKKVLFGEFK